MQSLQENVGDGFDFFPADKHKLFLKIDSTTLRVRSQACRKYPEYQVCKIFAISHKKREDEVHFLPAYKHQRFLQMDTIILGMYDQTCQSYPKLQV